MKVAHCKPGPKYHSSISKAEAQTALLEYLHVTRNLPFTDAEYMSKNSPLFIKNLLKNVEVGQKIKWSLMKFFCYHPINEFEPFFESMGLTGSELDSILPQDLLFLKDDGLLLENYHALCNYGVPRGMIGKIYREAKEVFRYDYGVLHSTLYGYKDMGLSQTSVIKVVVSSPSLLIGGVNGDFRKVLDMFRSLEIDFEWIEECISDNDTYDWSQVLGFLNFVCRLDYSKEELRALVKTHPGLLLEGSGRNAFHLVKILLKLGFTGKEVASLLLRLPQIQVGTFAKNLDRCLSFLMHIEMDSEDIARIVRAHTVMLGTLYLKKANTVQNELSIGRTRLCKIVKGNPYQLKNWALGMKLEPLRNSAENQSSLMQKKEFLLKYDGLLLENYHALCNYGVPRGMIGKIYREAKEVFSYDYGVLRSTLYSYKDMGLSQTSVIKVVVSSPSLLIGGVNGDFRKVLDMFRSLEIDFEWIEECISDNDTYDWSQVLGFLNFVCRLDYSKEELRALVKTHPGLLLEGSGRNAFHLVKILVKLGFTGKEVASLLLRLPQIQVGTFAKNLDRCLSFLMHIEMDSEDIARIVRAHTVMLGTLYLKKANTVLTELSIGRTKLCKIVKGNPYQLKNWALGMKLEPLRNSAENQSSLMQKEFLLKDDDLLLENYHALCNYGVPRGMIGKIYREAKEVFRYDYGVLHSTLYSYKDMGLSQTSVIKVVVSSPSLLIGGVNGDFRKVLDMFRSLEIDFEWIEECISDNDTYDWSQVLGFLNFVCQLDYSKEELRALVKTHPGLLLEGSGRNAFHLIKILLKLGFTGKEVASLLLRLPQIQVGTFAKNLDRCLSFLMHIEMDSEDIAKIVRAHTVMLGTFPVKKVSTVQSQLSIGTTRLCKIVKGNPYQLKNWSLGMKLEPLRNSAENQSSLMQKKEFLLNLGYIDNSDDLNKALKAFRGKGGELQGRFDCLLKAGVDSKDIIEMVKLVPKILNHRTDVLERKIDFLLNGCCYPVSCLVGYPSLITLNSERVRLRLLMYSWLRDEGVKSPHLSPNSYMTCSDKIFIKRFVNRHPGGPEVWESIKKEHRL
ncbi:hypothetical protein IFM89_021478 [Coptis chinensis]|uniref:Uncharacterized protein n=1 Tax=Coptis chinensis TaxID=261450 RepID=A0A835IQ39_9MAGN|nr:hypothetical protein IFM89_021478 [Coptis chinensis]